MVSNPVSRYFPVWSSSIRWNHIFADMWAVFTDASYGGAHSAPRMDVVAATKDNAAEAGFKRWLTVAYSCACQLREEARTGEPHVRSVTRNAGASLTDSRCDIR